MSTVGAVAVAARWRSLSSAASSCSDENTIECLGRNAAGAVVPQEGLGGRGQFRWGEAQRVALGCVDDQAGDGLAIGGGGEAPTDGLA